MDIWRLIERARAGRPATGGVVDGGRRLSYAETAERAEAFARHLLSRGVGPGDRVAACLENGRRFLEAYFAAAAIGAVLVPLNLRLADREIEAILGDSGAGLVLRPDDEIDAPRAAAPLDPARVAPDDPAQLYYTSGTTGRPKGVVLTHRNVCVHSTAAVEELGLAETDVWGHIAPMFHLADAWATFAITEVRGTHVMVPRFDADLVFDAIERERITITNLIPSMLNALLKHPRARTADVSSLRVVLSGGAPIAPELVRRTMETFGCDYVQTYGMTETSPYLTLSILPERLRALPPEEQLAYKAKTGRPMKGVELRVVDEAGRDVPPDERTVGEILVRGETVTPGYWNRPDETAAAFEDGWLRTGDLAVLDPEGFVNIVDRKKDMIISGGENVYSIEVENVLYEHPAVLEAAAFGVPDEEWGEAVCAAVALREGRTADEETIREFCRGRLASFKVPKRVHLVDALPKTGSGKVSKRTLRERHG